MRKRWRHNARQSGEGGLIDELLRNVMATQHLKVKLAAHHVHNIVHIAILGSVAIFMLNNITPKSSMANYHPLHYLVKGSHCVNNLTQIAGRTADPWITPMVVGVGHASKVPVTCEPGLPQARGPTHGRCHGAPRHEV